MRRKVLKATPFIGFILFISLLLFGYYSESKEYRLFIVIFISGYWLYRNFTFVVFTIIGLLRRDKLEFKISSNELPTQLFAIAVYGESEQILLRSIQSILNSDYPLNKIFISISLEERRLAKDIGFQKLRNTLEKGVVQKSKGQIYLTTHPSNLKDEVAGAASNKNWAARQGVKYLSSMGKINEETLITIPDADTVFSSTYAKELAVKSKENPEVHKFFQSSLYKVSNNFDQLSFIPKVLSVTLTQSIIAASNWFGSSRYTFSCFSMKVSTLKKVDFWDTTTSIDDTPFYWRFMSSVQKQPVCVGLSSAISVDGIQGGSLKEILINQYNQLYRWEWGASTMSYGFTSIRASKESILEKSMSIIRMLDRFILIKLLPLMILVGFSATSFKFWSVIVYINLMFLSIEIFLANYILKQISSYSIIRLPISIVTFPFSITILTFYGFIPYFHAAFDIMKGKESYNSVTWTNKT